MRLSDEPRWVRKVRAGMLSYGRTRALQLLAEIDKTEHQIQLHDRTFVRLHGVMLDPDNYKRTWPLVFRLHFPPARDLDDEELALSLAEGAWKAPLPMDWPHGPLQRAYERLAAEARITDAAAESAHLFADEDEEPVVLPEEEVDLTEDLTSSLPESEPIDVL